MPDHLRDIQTEGLRNWLSLRTGFELEGGYDELRPQQGDALEWAFSRNEPYLLLNGPTGSGKTLINLVYGTATGPTWTYAVNTNRLQSQVAATLAGLPTLTGRSNWPCLVAHHTHGFDVSAQYGICTMGQECPERPVCPYYVQVDTALDSPHRVTNYSMFALMEPLRLAGRTRVLLADEAHNVEEVMTSVEEFSITTSQLRRVGYWWPKEPPTHIMAWRGWAMGMFKKLMRDDMRPAVRDLLNSAVSLAGIKADAAPNWTWTYKPRESVKFRPLWGTPFVMPRLLNLEQPDEAATLNERSDQRFALRERVLFTSATLMGADYIAEKLGLPDGSWAYLDLRSVFDASHRPINFVPVEVMNRDRMATLEGRAPVARSIDALINHYVMARQPWGVIHAVSNRYRDQILTESRWSGIMTTSPEEHHQNVISDRASVLVAANLTEGWDGVDNLCRFVIMPKVPYGDLSDEWTRRRMRADARSYDYNALVSVVQGAGRGVRSREDYADTWILDAAWQPLYQRRKEWLPDSFLDAYHHRVALPQ